MKGCSNDDILNCDVPINGPGKVTIISMAVRYDCSLKNFALSHNAVASYAFYVASGWFSKAEVKRT